MRLRRPVTLRPNTAGRGNRNQGGRNLTLSELFVEIHDGNWQGNIQRNKIDVR